MAENSVLKKYVLLMLEIRRRLEVIQCFRDETCHGKYKIINYEVIFFQLRKILEIIVKAPILINEIEYRKLYPTAEKDWRIKDILQKLNNISIDHYPKPVDQVMNYESNIMEFVRVKEGFLTKEELIDAYQFCSSFLHSHNPLAEEEKFESEKLWMKVLEIANKVHRLLSYHIFHPINSDNMYLIVMENGKGFPEGYVWEKVGDLNK